MCSISGANCLKLASGPLFASAVFVVSGQGGNNDSARDLLSRYLERGNKVPLRSIVEHGFGMRTNRTMQLKIEQDGVGRFKATVLQPLSDQGKIIFDDGRKFMNYHPDENRLTIQDSPSLRAEDPRARMKLAALNYFFKIEKGPEIAGRRSVVVVASPRAGEMPVRRYSLESIKSVLLRLEIELSSGERYQLLDTKAITFLPSIPTSTFTFKPLSDVRIIELPSPTRIDSPEQAKEALGFEPILPQALPYGFVARVTELTGKNDCPMLAVRITDGLAYATVYQWKRDTAAESERRWRQDGVRVGDINLRIAGDLPDTVRQRILETFAKSSLRTNGRGQEPDLDFEALYPSRGKLGQSFDSKLDASCARQSLRDGTIVEAYDQNVAMLIEALSLLSQTQESI